MNVVYTAIVTILAIVLSEIAINYGLGDLVKDSVVRVFGAAESMAVAKLTRLRAQVQKMTAKV
jgi:hypothetical protein